MNDNSLLNKRTSVDYPREQIAQPSATNKKTMTKEKEQLEKQRKRNRALMRRSTKQEAKHWCGRMPARNKTTDKRSQCLSNSAGVVVICNRAEPQHRIVFERKS